MGCGEDHLKAKGSTSNEPTASQYKQKEIDHQIIGNSTIAQQTTEEGLVTREYPITNRANSATGLDPKVVLSKE